MKQTSIIGLACVLFILVAVAMGTAPRSVLAQSTDTPTATLTSTPTVTRTPIATFPPASTPTTIPVNPDGISSAASSSSSSLLEPVVGTAIGHLMPVGTPLSQANDAIATLRPLATGTALPTEFTISDQDPMSLARGFVVVMSDFSWFSTLLGFFATAFSIIMLLMVIRFVVSLWGIIQRLIVIVRTVMDAIKLIPFL